MQNFMTGEEGMSETEQEARGSMGAGKTVGAVTSAVRILRHLAESRTPLASNRIARDLGLNPSTCFNILKTLEFEGLTYCDADTKRHRLGLSLVELAGSALSQLGYRELIRPHVERIARDHNVAATLWLRTGADRVVLIDLVESDGPVKIAMRIGQRLPIFAGALGRCFAAHDTFSRDALRRTYAKVRGFDPVPFDQFVRESEEARERGYAVDVGNFARGITTVSSVIVDAGRNPIIAVSGVALSANLQPAAATALGEDLANTADVMSRTISGIPDIANVKAR